MRRRREAKRRKERRRERREKREERREKRERKNGEKDIIFEEAALQPIVQVYDTI